MPRPKAITPNEHLHITLRPDLKFKLDNHIYSEVEQRIPKGAHKEFVEARIQEFFEWRHQPLDAFGFPPGYFITGPSVMVESLIRKLKGETK